MSILTITPDAAQQRQIRQLIDDLLDGVISLGKADIRLPDPFTVTKRIQGDYVEITWQNDNPEVDIPGPISPDLLRIRCWPTETRVFLRLSDIRVVHDAEIAEF